MASVTIYGYSDDLVEIEGDLEDEFSAHEVDDQTMLGLAFGDGTVLQVVYTDAGVWRITQFAAGSAAFTKVEAPLNDEDNYSDRVTLSGDLDWVLPSASGSKLKTITDQPAP